MRRYALPHVYQTLRERKIAYLALAVLLVFSMLAAIPTDKAQATPGVVVLCSTDSSGVQASADSGSPAMSADGRYVVFSTEASNLVAGDDNGFTDVFRKDLDTGAIVRCSTDSSGNQADNVSTYGTISADGSYVFFHSSATNLVAGDTNEHDDIFRKDMGTGAVVRCSTDASGDQANNDSSNPSISADGRYVAFDSMATDLVVGDTNTVKDIFHKDLGTGAILRCSTDSSGNEGTTTDTFEYPAISPDGRYVVFYSNATTLVAGDTNAKYDIFRKDTQTNATIRCSTDSTGAQVTDDSYAPVISEGGRYVFFQSEATDLVAGDTNSQTDIFRKDLQDGTVLCCSTDSAGAQANDMSMGSSMTPDGRYVAFYSYASNLVADDTNGDSDVFLKDTQSGETLRCSTTTAGDQATGGSYNPWVSSDGTYVAFESTAADLVSGDSNGYQDIFRKWFTPPPTVTAISPASSTDEEALTGVVITGTGFADGAEVELRKLGQAAIEATGEVVDSDTQITCDLDLTGAATGTWDVVVINPDTQEGKLIGGMRVNLAWGSLAAWGYNGYHECDVPAGNDFIAVSGGGWHSLALRSDGTLAAWGENGWGQCNVPTGTDFVAVSAGGNHSLALRSDGSIVGWGYNEYGQATPPAGTDFVAISASDNHSLALRSDGALVAWGDNRINVPAGNDFVAISSGGGFGLALRSDGSIAGWGVNTAGQSTPPAGNDYVAIAAGSSHSLALKVDGSLAGWGDNFYGQNIVPAGNDFTAISEGGGHSLALRSDGSIAGWGFNDYGQCDVPAGNDFAAISGGGWHSLAIAQPAPTVTAIDPNSSTNEEALTGVVVTGTGFLDGTVVELRKLGQADIAATNVVVDSDTQITCDLDLNVAATGTWDVVVTNPHAQEGVLKFGFRVDLGWGSLDAWGYNPYGQATPPAGSDFIAISAGYLHSLALRSDGSLAGWGYNNRGQCDVPAGNDYIQVAAGWEHSMALCADGSLAAWGDNTYGQLTVPAGNDFVDVSGAGHSCIALRADGSVVGWGDNGAGQRNVPAGNDYVAIAESVLHGLALRSDGSLVAWGRNSEGQCNVPAGNDFVAVAGGSFHSLALRSDGSLIAWGENSYGQCTVPIGNGFVAISAAGNYCLALRADGSLVAWGDNSQGQRDIPSGNDFVAVSAGYQHGLAIAQPAPTVTAIAPASGTNEETVTGVQITGTDFRNGATVALRKLGQSDIAAQNVVVDSGTQITCDLPLTGAATGLWDVVVINPDAQEGTLRLGFRLSLGHGSLMAWGRNDYGQCDVPAGNDFVDVVGGWLYSHALHSDGSLEAWGDNTYHQCEVPAGNDYIAIAGRYYHGLALKTDGSIVGWGLDDYGQATPPAGNDYVAISGGDNHSLALKSDGSIEGWGRDNYGQATPPAGSDFVAIGAGEGHSVALRSDGSIVSWGWDGYGQVSNTPSGNDFIDVRAGGYYSVALKSDGTLVAWGYAGQGQCNVPTDSDFVIVTAGAAHGLAQHSDGSLAAWGINQSGQCDVPTGTDYVAIAGGAAHSLVIAQFPAPTVTGIDPAYGHQNQALTGVKITGSGFYAGAEALLRMGGQADIAATNVVVDSDTQITCDFDLMYATTGAWDVVVTNHDLQSGTLAGGFNIYLPVVNSVTPNHAENTGVVGLNVRGAGFVGGAEVKLARDGFSDIGATNESVVTDKLITCDVDLTGVAPGSWDLVVVFPDASTCELPNGFYVGGAYVSAWGDNAYLQVSNAPTDSGFVAVAAGRDHSLGLKADGSIVAWGRNSEGQCTVPEPNSGFVAVSAGYYHSIGLRSDGSVAVWGSNTLGQRNIPAPNSGFVAVAAGWYHCLGLKADGSIVAWGDASNGKLNVPAPNSGFVAVAGGHEHSVGLKADGSVLAWGNNTYGQCNVPGPNSGFVAVSAGWRHSLGLKADGSIVAWGDGTWGQTSAPYPNSGFVAVSAGGTHNLGLKSDGSVVGWGNNNDGKINIPTPNVGYTAVAAGGGHSLALHCRLRVDASAPGGGGSVNPATQQVSWGGTASIDLIPDPNYHVVSITDNGEPQGLTDPYVINNVKRDHVVVVTYAIDTHTLTVNTEGDGSVAKVPDQAEYDHGTSVQLTANPAAGWHFVEWTGDAGGSNNPADITMDADKTVTATFALNVPVIGSITPDVSKINGLVTIAGTDFGATRGTSKVRFGDVVATYYESWSDTQIVCKVPPGTSGALNVTVTTQGGASNAYAFKVLPRVTKLVPKYGVQGATILVKGSGFGATRGTSYIKFGTLKATTYVSWTATEIQVKVPAGAAGLLNLSLTTAGGVSNLQPFKVTPKVTKISPTRGPVGTTVTLTGTGFGSKRGTSTVKFGITAVTNYVSWSNTQIVVKVPATGTGTKLVKVTTTGGTSAGASFTVQ